MNKIFQLYRDNATRRPVNAVKNGEDTAIYIYDIIAPDWGVSALDVIDAISAAGSVKVLHVYINSPGGDVFEGRAIMAAIKRAGCKTIAHIDSLCASAATSVALSCDEVEMEPGAFFMIHNASGMVWGDKSDMRDTADLLEKVEGSIIADYTGKTGMDSAEIIAAMDAETWYSADEALAAGFVDSIAAARDKSAPGNSWNLSAYANAPAELSPEPTQAATSMTQANANRLRLSVL